MELLHLFGHELEAFAGRNEPISPLNQILITLRFYATGAFQQLLGDHNKIAKSTTSSSEVAYNRAHVPQETQWRDSLTCGNADFHVYTSSYEQISKTLSQ